MTVLHQMGGHRGQKNNFQKFFQIRPLRGRFSPKNFIWIEKSIAAIRKCSQSQSHKRADTQFSKNILTPKESPPSSKSSKLLLIIILCNTKNNIKKIDFRSDGQI